MRGFLKLGLYSTLCVSVAVIAGCGGGGGTKITTQAAATPTFSPAAGAITSATSVTISDTTPGATIYYTTNGSTPTTASSVYSAPINVTSTTTIEALATATGYTNSAVASGTYTLSLPVAATPTFSPTPGTYTSSQNVTISDSTPNSSIYYTTNGAAPTDSSTLYSAAIPVTDTTTIKAIAMATNYAGSLVATGTYTITQPAEAPVISTSTSSGAQNGAEMLTLASATPGATIYYTIDGSTPTASSIIYLAPFMVASNLTVNAIAVAPGYATSSVTTQAFAPDIASGTLVWSDEFANTGASNAEPNSAIWGYDTGGGGWGNSELEDYCAYGSTDSPCNASNPNAFVAPGGGLNIVAEEPTSGNYTSARMKTEGLFSFQYGRIEVKAKVPEAQGFWPAFWLLGNDINTVGWPACGEIDVLERIDAATSPDWNAGSIHGTGFTGSALGSEYSFPTGETAADWHTYGMIWSKGSVSFYIDDPTKPYSTYTPSSISGYNGSVWPFDSGPQFIIMNVAVGGGWPGNPDSTTPFPSTMQVQYVRIYSN